MKAEKIVTLERPARKAGGDRYKAADGFQIYIPQDISRPNGMPLQTLRVTFEDVKGGD